MSNSSSDIAAPVEPGNAAPDDYPRMLFHPDGRTATVPDAAEHERLHKEGWGTTPDPVHRQQASVSPVMSGSDPFALMIRGVLEAVLDERGLTEKFTSTLAPPAPPAGEAPRMPPTKGGSR